MVSGETSDISQFCKLVWFEWVMSCVLWWNCLIPRWCAEIRPFRRNDCNLHYHCLTHPVFLDTILASIVYRRGNRCAQVYMPLTLDGADHFQWYPEVRHMRPCNCCFLGKMFCQLVFVTLLRRLYKVGSIRSSRLLHASCNSWNHILHGWTMQKERLDSFRNGLVASCFGQEHQRTYGINA